MKIVILDGYTTNPGDISFSEMETLGRLTVYDRTPAELVLKRALDADILLTNKTVLDAELIERLPNLKYIGLLSTGVNVVDLPACDRRGIPVTNVPGYSTPTVAQMVFAMLNTLCFHVQQHSDSVHNGGWARSKDFCYWKAPLIELYQKTLGIVGYGSIGRQVAAIGRAFGMRILVYSRTMPADLPAAGLSPEEWVAFEELLARADFITLHCPLTDSSSGLIGRDALGRMKPSAYLINTARGGLIDEQALADALNSGIIAGAALDVLSKEPPLPDHPLLTAKNCLITPHIAWASREARTRLVEAVCKNIQSFLSGGRRNVVNLKNI